MGLFHSDSNRIIKHFLQEGIWLKTDISAQGEHTSFLGPLLPWAYFVPALFLPQCLLFIPLPLPEVQVLHPLRMGLLGFWNHPALIPLISVLRIQGLASHNVVWPFKPRPRSLDGFTLGSGPFCPCSPALRPPDTSGLRGRWGRVWAGTLRRCLSSTSVFTISFPFVLRACAVLTHYLVPGLYLSRTMVLKL